MPSSNITGLTNLATPVPSMLLYAGLSPFGPFDDRKVTANNLFSTITVNITDLSLQFDNGLGTATVSAAGKGKLRYNDTTKSFQFSADGAAYAPLGGGMAIGGTVTAGTAGSVLFVAAGPVLAQNNANFFWDDATTRLGLGNNSPTDTLDVRRTSILGFVARIQNLSENGRSAMRFMDDGGNEQGAVGSGNGFSSAPSNGKVFLGTYTTQSLILFVNTLENLRISTTAFTFTMPIANTNTVGNYSTVVVNSTGAAANGFGASETYQLETTTTDSQDAAARIFLWTTATHASRSAAYAVQIVDNANALAEKWRIAGNGAGTGTLETLSGVNGSQRIEGEISELLTLSTVSTTTDTTMQLPANSIILSVTTRVTTTITTAVSFSVGDPTTAARFSASAGGLTAGSTRVGLDQMQGSIATDAAGPVQTTAASVRITTNANPGAGVIRITIHYLQFIAPTS